MDKRTKFSPNSSHQSEVSMRKNTKQSRLVRQSIQGGLLPGYIQLLKDLDDSKYNLSFLPLATFRLTFWGCNVVGSLCYNSGQKDQNLWFVFEIGWW